MNKELIKKYFTEFNHWLNNGLVLLGKKDLSNTKIKWYPSVQNPFEDSSDTSIIVINDKFVEIRKAIAEGKTIEYNFGNFGPNKQDFPDVWRELNLSIGIIADRASPENYRIKPELDIKVGDWLLDTHYKTYDRVKEIFTHTVLLQSNLTVFKDDIEDGYFKIWKPEVGEWCIEDISNSVNFDNKHFVVQQWQENSTWTPIPYTGPLPYFIKE